MEQFSILRYSFSRRLAAAVGLGLLVAFAAGVALGQSNSGTVSGVVADSTGAVIPNAKVVIANAATGYTRTTASDASGQYQFVNLPYNKYRVTATSAGFQNLTTTVQVSSSVATVLPLTLAAGATETITVEAPPDLVENDSAAHTDIDRSEIERMPMESLSSGLSSIITLSSPGVSADSDGQVHGLGDHAENSMSLDGQPISDQQSKVFSNQVPSSAVQSLEVIEGAPPAEYGDKTSLVIKATTRSGQGVTTPTGSVTMSYGTFGSSDVAVDLAYGGKNWGNFIAADGLQSGRFLDAPEFAVMHDKGNEANVFDRFDVQVSKVDSIHVNMQYTRSWFQTPNTWDTQYGFVQSGATHGPTDQRSKIETVDFAPSYSRTIGQTMVFNFGPYLRRDSFNYYPSSNSATGGALNDLGPIEQESVAQQRSLTNAGVHSDISYVKGVNNIKIGGMYQQTFLRENFQIGIVDPNLNVPGTPGYQSILRPYDLTRGGADYGFHGRTDVKQLGLYGQDEITVKNWLFNVGIRGDIYNGLTIQRQAEPRVGLSYDFKKTATVLRASYARTQETPFNENLVLSSKGCEDAVINAIFSTIGPCTSAPFNPGFRNEFHAGLQQGIGRHFVFSGEYIWKYTHNGYDFSVLGATPITFPIEWHNSKIPGYTLSLTMTPIKGLSAHFTGSSVAARFFNPQIGGIGSSIGAPGGYPFRIDHDEHYNETTHVEYSLPKRKSLYYSFNWRFDSGQVAGGVPCYGVTDPNSTCGQYSTTVGGVPTINTSSLTNDEEFQAGLICNGKAATHTSGFTSCAASQLTSSLVNIPAAGTENDDKNPQRIKPRNLFDMAVGDDKLLHWGANEKYKIGATVTAINVANKYALYNFLSTFSGTHYVTPRTLSAQVAFHF